MHVSERNRLTKRRRVLALAIADMLEVKAAVEGLEAESSRQASTGGGDVSLLQALETAAVVAYARPFKKANMGNLDPKVDRPDSLVALHDALISLRDQVYAHTDKEAGRSAELTFDAKGDLVSVTHHWQAFPAAWRTPLIELTHAQIAAFAVEHEAIGSSLASDVEVELDDSATEA